MIPDYNRWGVAAAVAHTGANRSKSRKGNRYLRHRTDKYRGFSTPLLPESEPCFHDGVLISKVALLGLGMLAGT